VYKRQTTQFLYDSNDIVAEFQGGAMTTSYLRSLNIDEAFGILRQDGTYFYLFDGLSSTLALTNQAAASVVQYTYEPFGTTQSSNPAFANPFQFTGRENDGMGLYSYRARYYSPMLQRFLSEDPLGIRSPALNGCNIDRVALAALTSGLGSETITSSDLSPAEVFDILQTPAIPQPETDLYIYVNNDPVNALDPAGLQGGRGKFLRCLGKYIADVALCVYLHEIKKPDPEKSQQCRRSAARRLRICLGPLKPVPRRD
jgi:RHS repeat-associated protein